MPREVVFIAGKDPLEETGGGHSSYVRAHARAAIRAGWAPRFRGATLIPERYLYFVTSLPERERYQQTELLVPDLRMGSDDEGKVVVYYAPVEWRNPEARLAIVGVTPGFTQMEIAVRVARRELLAGADPDTACRRAKCAACFAGPMRQNLVSMLDGLTLSEFLGCAAEALFTTSSHLLHATFAVCFPVFVDGQNHTGSRPRLIRSGTQLDLKGGTELGQITTDSVDGKVKFVLGLRWKPC